MAGTGRRRMSTPAPLARDPYLAWALATGFAGHSALAGRAANGFLPLLLDAPPDLAQHHPTWRHPPHYASRPGIRTAWVPAAEAPALAGLDIDCAMSLPLRDVASSYPHRPPPGPGKAGLPVIGVIDNGCAFLNQVFSEPGAPQRSRFVSLWRQRPAASTDGRWRVPADFGYGLELLGADMRPCPPDGEAAAYAGLGYPVDDAGRLSTMLHGTHVLDIAAGLPQPLPSQAAAKPAEADVASRAGLVFVELPQPLPEDSTGASLDAFILDAVHYVLSRAAPGQRVIVNLSIGAQAGPHDGSSLIERALNALIEAEAGRLSICVAAGNGALERWLASGTLPLSTCAQKARAGWRTVPGDTTDSFMELWASAGDAAGLAGLSVTLTAPDGRVLHARLGEDGPQRLAAADGRLQATLDLRRSDAAGPRHRASALISLAPTAGSRAGLGAGLWQVALRRPRKSTQPCQVDLWLQRDTPGRSLREVLQSEFEVLSPLLDWNGRGALSHLAGASRVITVGAARRSDGQPSRYSPRRGVDAWATADESPQVYGLLCSGGFSGSVFRISGTSAATPMVVRALANRTLTLPAAAGASLWESAKQPLLAKPLVRPDGSRPGSMPLDVG
jgi:hypothetical protein